MASSSDWIAHVGASTRTQPAWLAAMRESDGFSSLSPFADASAPVSSNGDAASDAYARGLADGRAEALAEARAEIEAHRAIRLTFRELDQQALDTLSSDLSDTVIALCSRVIDERSIDRDALAERCRKSAERIGAAAAQCTLRLHPADLELLSGADLGGLTPLPDPSLERGALSLEGPDGAVRDGPAEWRRAIAAALQP